MRFVRCWVLVVSFGCASAPEEVAEGVVAVNLRGDAASFATLRAALRDRNPGYDVEWSAATRGIDANDSFRVAFVQGGAATATVQGETARNSAIEVGAALALRPLERADFDSPVDLVIFTVPQPFSADTPSFLRPDFDPRIDDQQGGCATEEGPYRRLLLTWRPENGPYVHHGLNAHRVRITNSFTHYHPEDGGFDEMYLVQSDREGATLFTSHERARIEAPESVGREEARTLLRARRIAADDFVFLPRGVVHRGVGGAIVMVITIPGFKPGAEIGVDHHLRAISERCVDEGGWFVPYNVDASGGPVVR